MIKGEDAPKRREHGLDRAMDLMEALRRAREPMRPNELATLLGAPRSSVHEMVGRMLALGLLDAADGDGRVFLGRKLYLFGIAYLESSRGLRLAEAALERITAETRELSQFCALDGNRYVVLRQRESARPFRISADTGQPIPIPQTASGRLLVSDLGDDEIRALIPPEDFRTPAGAPIDPDGFIAEVRAARQAGVFSFDSMADTFTHCFAVPVEDASGRVAATLCIVAPIDDANANRDAYVACLKAAAEPLHGRI
ncbi:IclR family transcriptional regulator [Mangrovicoccus sp. HB161399]|uniref:IclR family transcriptional regulator n=1 Tax=Mangrovicoccus sp. HB161399 TaxID=2720392 RepID=UPI001555232C|nr:IclR family transcriptional regulator [Mangrovicoccus sp. HB161399]